MLKICARQHIKQNIFREYIEMSLNDPHGNAIHPEEDLRHAKQSSGY